MQYSDVKPMYPAMLMFRKWIMLSLACLTSHATIASQKPNFVFLLVDDLGWGDFGCYGAEFYETPNIDNLAGQGMCFSDAYGAIRFKDWKLIEFFEDGSLELYNLNDDPNETTNLAARHPEQAAKLLADLRAWRKQVGAQMPAPNPNHDPSRAGQRGKTQGRENRGK